jgi:iron complex transport system ATP-binding protein
MTATGREMEDSILYKLASVSFALAGNVILQPLSLTLRKNRVYAIVGPNGSGKTTLMKLLARQLAPTTGTIGCMGKPMIDWRNREFARAIAYMPQFPPAANGLTVRELVALGRYPWHGALGAFGGSDRQAVAVALERCGIDGFGDRLVDTLSGGERQRAWLAMMMAQSARCLLLDEPTSALDLARQVEMLKLIRELGRASGIGAVLVLHDINLASQFCSEILALRDGRLLAMGPPGDIMHTSLLGALYETGIDVLTHPQTGARLAYVR